MPKRKYTIDILAVALDVVESFVKSPDGARGVTEISRLTGLKKDRVFRVLSTLAERGYMEQDRQTQKYRLGSAFLVLGEAFRKQTHLAEVAKPFLLELAEKSGDAAHLLVRHGYQAICLDVRVGKHVLQAKSDVGQILPCHTAAAPKILLAFLPPEQRREVLDNMTFVRFTPVTITSRSKLEKELATIRAQGYCVAEDDYELGSRGIAAPVRDASGSVVATLSVATPQSRYDSKRKAQLIEWVVDSARRLSERLGHVHAPGARFVTRREPCPL